VLAALALAAVAVGLFVDLRQRPMPVQDEGAIMLVAKTWAQDGVLATRTSEGCETFGAIQSVGPTLLGPVALAFKYFGAGIQQGRAVAAILSWGTALAMLCLAWQLFGWRCGLLALGFLVASSTVAFIGHGRQVLGEVPAVGFLAAGAYVWARNVDQRATWPSVLAGLLMGAAMVTKPQYVAVTLASLILCAVLAVVYYGRQHLRAIALMGATAALCAATWHLWQRLAFGPDLYAENAAKLRALARLSYGLDWHVTVASAKLLFGSQSDHLYYFAGPVALLHAIPRCRRSLPAAIVCAFLLAFVVLWLTAFLLFLPPVPRFVLGPVALCALFVAHLWENLIVSLARQDRSERNRGRVSMRAMAAGAVLVVMLAYALQRAVSTGLSETHDELTQLGSFLERAVPADRVIETWDREVGMVTNHAYHYPDQVLLGPANAAAYRGGPRTYALGAAYFSRHAPSYVIVGWYARFSRIYDEAYLSSHGARLATIGEGDFRYDVIKLCSSSGDARCPP
jgi:hypothetical protein